MFGDRRLDLREIPEASRLGGHALEREYFDALSAHPLVTDLEWPNQYKESGEHYDFKFKIKSVQYYMDAKGGKHDARPMLETWVFDYPLSIHDEFFVYALNDGVVLSYPEAKRASQADWRTGCKKYVFDNSSWIEPTGLPLKEWIETR